MGTGRQTNSIYEVVYSTESPLSNPATLVRDIFKDIFRYRDLITTLFLRDLTAQFRQSYFGYLWLFLPPLITTTVWIFLNSQNVLAVGKTDIPYPIYVIIGSVVWQTFVKLVQSPLTAIHDGKPVFSKLKVPPEAFVAAGTLRALFDLTIYLVILIPILFIFDSAPGFTLAYLPIALFSLIAIGTALGLMLVPIGTLYSDVGQSTPMILGFLMYLAPVVYPPPTTGWASVAISWNPITPILMNIRNSLTNSGNIELVEISVITCFSMLMITGCLIGIRVTMPHLVSRMGM